MKFECQQRRGYGTSLRRRWKRGGQRSRERTHVIGNAPQNGRDDGAEHPVDLLDITQIPGPPVHRSIDHRAKNPVRP
jgi:hypothetical protein